MRPLKAQLGELTAAQERAAAFAGYDLTDSHQKRYESWYRTEQDGVPDGERVSLADWLKAQEEDPVVGPGLRAVVKGAKSEPAPKAPAKPPTPPPREPPATQPPATRSTIPSPEQLDAKYKSPEFLALPVAERRAAVAADRALVAGAGRT